MHLKLARWACSGTNAVRFVPTAFEEGSSAIAMLVDRWVDMGAFV